MLLEIGNSECRISDVDSAMMSKLKDVLSYTTAPAMNFYTKTFSSQKRTLLSKQGMFPTGLLPRLSVYLESINVKPTTKDLRIQPRPIDGYPWAKFDYEPYDTQNKAALAAWHHTRGVIVAPTGLGKSTIVALIIKMVQVKTLVIVPNLELKRQLSASLKLAFGTLEHIVIENIDSPRLNKLKDFDALIIDEFHHSAAKTYRKLNKTAWSGIFYKFGLTATPFRSQDSENILLESVLSNVIYEIRYQDAVKAGQIVPMEAYYYDLPKQSVKGHTWAQVYNELVVNNKPRNLLIADIMTNLHAGKHSALVLVREIAHGDALVTLTGAPFANGQDESKTDLIDWFNLRKFNVLIGTTGVLGEGVDTKPAEYVVIAGLGKSRNAFCQQIGRGFRVYPGKGSCKIVLFRDPSHRWTKEHFKAQCQILLEQFGVVPTKIS